MVQRAKSYKLNLSDRNTKFFHSLVKRNYARNSISFIHKADGSITGDMNQIVGDFTNFYLDLFGKSIPRLQVDWCVFNDGEVLSQEDQASLIYKVTKEEIREAMFGIGNEKVPGPDGFPAGFLRKIGTSLVTTSPTPSMNSSTEDLFFGS